MLKKYQAAGIALIASLFALACGAGKAPTATAPAAKDVPDAGDEAKAEEPDVPFHTDVTAMILARCEHAAEVMRSLLAAKREMQGALALRIGYIGLINEEGNIDPSVGETEIAAARVQVCVAQSTDDDDWLEYLECVYSGDTWRSMPEGWKGCATKAKVDTKKVEECLDAGNGDWILTKSYAASTASRIVSSPTIIIDGYLYGGGRSEKNFMQYLCHTAGSEETKPKVCDNVDLPPEIAATLLYDERCESESMCNVEGEIAVLEKLIPGFKLTRLDYSSEEGRHMYDLIQKTDTELKALPLIVLDKNIKQDESLKELLGDHLTPFGEGFLFSLGGSWDPTAEICTNSKDDNEDGKVDCEDATCTEKLACRKETKNRLDFFMMSGCPFALELIPSIDRMLNHFGRDRKAIDFHLQFIGDVAKDGSLSSMHGQEEVDENIRMLCIESLYPKKYQFMEYMLCRAEDPRSPAWEKCVPKSMNAKKITTCVEKKGEEMLRASFELAEVLEVRGSPTWILNNRLPMKGRMLKAMVEGFCEKNEHAACSNPVEAEEERQSLPSDTRCE